MSLTAGRPTDLHVELSPKGAPTEIVLETDVPAEASVDGRERGPVLRGTRLLLAPNVEHRVLLVAKKPSTAKRELRVKLGPGESKALFVPFELHGRSP